MDTRTKILTLEAARKIAGPVAIATGFFDVLRAAHARELSELREGAPVLVIVLPLEEELLDQRARAELAAGLRMVDYVVTADAGEADELIASLRPARVERMEAADAGRVQGLIDQVQRGGLRSAPEGPGRRSVEPR